MLKTIGTDTEVFAVDKDGIYRSLCGKIGGTKEEPKQLLNYPKGFCVQEDNVSLEFNIPPVITSVDFVKYVKIMMKENKKIVNSLGLEISTASSASFPKEELLHPNAIVFGCEPDYDAWKQIENPKPTCDDPTLRTAGGHVHVGTDVDMLTGIKAMDLFLGVPSILLDDTEASRKRRQLYGKAGALRPKNYGFEYRTLSNFWVFSEELIEWVYQQTKDAMRYSKKISISDGKKIQACINKGDKDVASALVAHYGLALPTL